MNVTGHQLEANDLALLIGRTLDRHGLSPEALEVELTESVALAEDARAAALCDELRRRGVQIAIDDFGTGYSSLSALRSLTFDKIKIDRAFVTDVDRRRDSQAICSSLFALGRGLGIKVLAEGVETAAEYLWLRRHGCRYFQGFYFSPPLESDRFTALACDPAAWTDRLVPAAPSLQQRRRMTASPRFFPLLGAGALGLALAACSSSPKVGPTAPVAVATQAEDIEAIAQLLDTGQVKEARKRLDRALRSDPMNPSLLVLRQGLEGDARADLGSTSYPYTVAPGDTMSALAERFLGNRLKSYQLARYNGLDDPAALAPGQVIQIPGQPPRAPQRPAAAAAPARTPSAPRASPPSRTPPAASAAPRPPAADTAGAQRARTAGLAALNKGDVAGAIAQLQRAASLDPGNEAISRDLARARRIAATVRSQR